LSTEQIEDCLTGGTAMAVRPPRLAEPALFRTDAYIAGEWYSGDAPRIEVRNPADDSVVGTVPRLGFVETETAINAAASAFPAWRDMLAKDRARVLRRWSELIRAHEADLALIMTLEQGKPLREATAEIRYGASFLDWFADDASRMYGETIPSHLAGSRLFTIREPVGVAAAITPWNFPSAMITRKVGAALAAGCPIVLRPADETPHSGLALAWLAEQAGVPAGVFSVVTGDAEEIALALTSSDTVRVFSFTGSTQVGRLLLAQCAPTVKRVNLELGGNAPFIVFPDADLEQAVQDAVAAKFVTSGQDCVAVNRIFVHESLFEPFVDRFVGRVAGLRVGEGLGDDVDVGPLIHDRALDRLEGLVESTIRDGARVLIGGSRHALGGRFFEPTVLVDVNDEHAIMTDEVFGPVVGITSFATEDEVVSRANATVYGLAAYVYARDSSVLFRVAEQLEFGMVALNTPTFTGAPIPFGGRKQSGLGREGSRHGLEEYTELKYVCLGGGAESSTPSQTTTPVLELA
jgi:succinate-semialdehyde dehydrogenase